MIIWHVVVDRKLCIRSADPAVDAASFAKYSRGSASQSITSTTATATPRTVGP